MQRNSLRFALAFALSLGLAACGGSSKTDTTAPPPPMAPTDPGGAAGGTKPADCIKTGCSGTICAEHGQDMMSTCEVKPEHGCYQSARCERQGNGKCGWTQSAELTACIANPPPM